MAKQAVKTYGPLFIIIAAFLWGIDGVLRRSLFGLPPTAIVFYEHLIGAIIIAPPTIIALSKEKVSIREWGALFWISLLSGVAGTLLFTAALVKINFISMSVVFLLQKLQPIFAVTAGVILLKEKIPWRYALWALFAFIAAYFVTFKNGQVNLTTGAGTAMAALMAVGAAFAWGSSTAVSRFTVLRMSNTLATGLRFFLTVPLALGTVMLFGDTPSLIQIETSQIVKLIIIALTTGMVALWIYYKGLQSTEVKVATCLEFIFPLTAVFIDVIYFHNVLAVSQYLAAVVLLFSIFKLSKLNNSK
jgi:drug/metabolite transporter (DMT)-like permease